MKDQIDGELKSLASIARSSNDVQDFLYDTLSEQHMQDFVFKDNKMAVLFKLSKGGSQMVL